MKRLTFQAPYNYDQIPLCNGNLKEYKTLWYLQPIDDIDSKSFNEIRKLINRTRGSYLHGFLQAIGSCRLWVGDLDGQIIPKDVEPQKWTYPSGEPVEKSWFWDWQPSEFSQKKLMEDLQKTNPFDFDNQGRLKSLVPMNFANRYGTITKIESIPVIRLPHIFRSCEWTFEIN